MQLDLHDDQPFDEPRYSSWDGATHGPYQEGRRVRRSRETRAMARRTDFGRELLAGQWAAAEFTALGTLWQAGAPVPYPVQLAGTAWS